MSYIDTFDNEFVAISAGYRSIIRWRLSRLFLKMTLGISLAAPIIS